MSEIETFLAQLAETERLAREATPGPWLHVDFAKPSGQPLTASGEQSTFMGCGSVITLAENVLGGDIAAPNGDLYPRSGYSPKEDMAHIAHWDPASTLRWVAAVREILRMHAPRQDHMDRTICDYCDDLCHSRSGIRCDDPDAPWPCPTVRALMSVYQEEGS